MIKNAATGFILATSLMLTGWAYAAGTPTLHQVYEAAQSGRLSEAQGMIQQVLKEHPNSAKAHFVDAELLAKTGRLAEAREEINTAERLEPGLPFAKPQAVQDLKARVFATTSSVVTPMATSQPAPAGFPWGLMLLGIGLIALIAFIVRAMSNRNTPMVYPGNSSQPYPASGYAPMAPQTSGMGGGLMSSLATGAALGAGVVAGEALAHHFIDGKSAEPAPAPATDAWTPPDNMGGTDFGIADNSSWDDNASLTDISGGDDWS